MNFAARLRRSGELPRTDQPEESNDKLNLKVHGEGFSSIHSTPTDELFAHEPAPPAYGDEHSTTLAIPANRLSESSRSDASSGDRIYGSTTTTTHTIQTTTTFFRLPRRKHKQSEPLFPIAHLQKSKQSFTEDPNLSSVSVIPSTPGSLEQHSADHSRGLPTPIPSRAPSRNGVKTPPPQNQAGTLLPKPSSPATALFRPASRHSGHSSPSRTHSHRRGRSSTMSSLGRNSPRESVDDHLAPPTTRTSMSTSRKSFGDLLGLNRLRNNGDLAPSRQGTLTPATPASNASKNNSLQLPRDSVVLPERRDDDTPAKYLERLLAVVSRSVVAAALSKSNEPFSLAVLRSYMRGFKFFGDPMDMALRKLLMEAELPKETQQIDRFVQAFANRYHECNPGIYSSPDQAYFIAFSLLILHTDVFNKNNKHKMQKADYLKNTRGEGIFDDILEVFYDNITYTPFIHVEDEFDINGERIVTQKARKKLLFPSGHPDSAKKILKEPVDPYALIIENRLDLLRPNLKDVMQLDDPYTYLGTAKCLNMKDLQKTFFKTGVLQIVSARSRPDAFMTDKTTNNPDAAHPGIVDIKITKVGLLWRKDTKKKKTRSPWQEWGAILTGAQLYFFRNTAWVKHLMHQQKDHIKKGHDGDPCIFKPPLDQFKPDALMSTDGAVALMDSSYTKHKHAFLYVRHGGLEEVLLAEDEDDMNDWLAKLNYAAAFRTSGVRMRGVIGGNYDGQSRRALRASASDNVQIIRTPSGEVTVTRSRIDHKMAQDILAARREIMRQKIQDYNEKLKEAETTLELQLRNARHLQILAPISQKTREQMLLSAARMAAQVKWTRMEIWKLKCHRDILQLDLEDERQSLGLPPDPKTDLTLKPITREDSKATQKPPPSPTHATLTESPSMAAARSDEDVSSPVTETFQTAPTSATEIRNTPEELPGMSFDHLHRRKGSVSTVLTSQASPPTTPPQNEVRLAESPKKRAEFDQHDDVDADERDLLEQAGLLEPEILRTSEQKGPGSELEETPERRRRGSTGAVGDRSERSKIRRSLQRTLREGAGHISHHRHRKGKESISNSSITEEANRDTPPDSLPRGSGSFVVHGKKASVVTLGNELQIQGLTADDRIRQRMHRDDASSGRTGPTESSDFQSVLTARATSEREHRESAASASTATARSFRELHRKYSTARAGGGNSLVVPSDEDSDAAVSFSDGRRTPLPPIEHEEEDLPVQSRQELPTDTVVPADADAGEYQPQYRDPSPSPSREERNTVFFTPDPPATPVDEELKKLEAELKEQEQQQDQEQGQEEQKKEGQEKPSDRLPSPPLQAVKA